VAEDRRRESDGIAALRLGLTLGMSLIDTAELYAGDAEMLVGEAIKQHREQVFLVSKILPNMRSGTTAYFLRTSASRTSPSA